MSHHRDLFGHQQGTATEGEEPGQDFLDQPGQLGWEEEPPWEPGQHREGSWSAASLFTAGAVVLLLAATGVGVLAVLRADPEPQALPTTSPPTSLEIAGSTTVPAMAPPPTTSIPSTTTSSAPFIQPQGEAIPLQQLRLATGGIGPLEMGQPGDEVLPRLSASLGQPDEDSGRITSRGEYGTCAGQQIRLVRWGALLVVVTFDQQGDGTFGAYRLDSTYGQGGQAAQLQTLSGLQLGEAASTLEAVYQRLDVQYAQHGNLGPIYEIRNRAGIVLIWGPLTSSQPDGTVRGIYSPNPCVQP
ncbi:MAG: hypothetical protein M3N51_05400 [Actinomycetota bacterium]|nr:hypothetical protein [Actinomycetota bacterium]